tara:strand:+ start:276 stop:1118 length:843 start_codon:yes stop_codon:yes gene_type:complete
LVFDPARPNPDGCEGMNGPLADSGRETEALVAGALSTFPSNAELARTLAVTQTEATVSTFDKTGCRYTSSVCYAVADDGEPIVLLSELAQHTVNVRKNQRTSMLITADAQDRANGLGLAQLTLVGSLRVVVEPEESRSCYLNRHPNSSDCADLRSFNFWQLRIDQGHFVSGVDHMGWVSAEAYSGASVDPLWPVSASILEHMNQDHSEANLAYVRDLAGLTDAIEAEMVGIDRYGVTLHANTASGPRIARVSFSEALSGPDQARPAVIELLEQAHRIAAP